MTSMKFTATAAGLVLACAASVGPAWAQGTVTVTIDPDSTANPNSANDVGSLSWGVGNTIATPVFNAGPAGSPNSVTDPQVGDIFQAYGHGRLASFNDADGNPLPGQDLNGDYEWTYVFGYQEEITGVTGIAPGGSINLLNVAGGDNFFRIYFDPLPSATAANSLLGTGFADGILVLEGTVLPFDGAVGTSTFANFSTVAVDLDQFGANNYDGGGASADINSVTGNGSAHYLVSVTSFDASFFPGGVPPLLAVDNNYFLNVPFPQTNPSGCFWDGTGYISGVGANNTGTQCDLDPITAGIQAPTNTVGSTNGQTTAGGGGPNEVFQTALTSSFTQIPEIDAVAGTGALTLLAGSLVLFSERRRRPTK